MGLAFRVWDVKVVRVEASCAALWNLKAETLSLVSLPSAPMPPGLGFRV